jgi:hypothetical protein
VIVITTPPARSAARCPATCSIAANSPRSSPATRHSSRPRSARTSTSSRARTATRRLWTRHSTPPLPASPGPAAAAFTRHGVGRVAGVSMPGRGPPWAGRAGFVTGSLAMDDLIAASGVAYRASSAPRGTRHRPAFANGANRCSSRRSPREHRLARTHTRAPMPASKSPGPHTGRVALATGAAHGIGQAIAAGLAERGTRIVLGDIDDVSEASDLIGATA